MTFAGAKGETANEMAKTLHFENGAEKTAAAFAGINARLNDIEKKGNVRLLVANSLWPQQGRRLLPNYVSSIAKYYGGVITPLDYLRHPGEALSSINGWVETKTQGKIKNAITPPLPSDTSLVLVDAIYFKGKWAKPFDPKQTTVADFTREDRSKTKVSMMRQSGQLGFSETQEAKLLELPYLGEELSMLVILPKDQVPLTALENKLTPANLELWLRGMKKRSVYVEIPKFKMTWGSFNLAKPLQKSGMRKPFSGGADFSGITGDKSLTIGKVLHKAVVEVNEEGTEAAAATADYWSSADIRL